MSLAITTYSCYLKLQGTKYNLWILLPGVLSKCSTCPLLLKQSSSFPVVQTGTTKTRSYLSDSSSLFLTLITKLEKLHI